MRTELVGGAERSEEDGDNDGGETGCEDASVDDGSTSALAELSQTIAGDILTLPALNDPDWDTFAMAAEVTDYSVKLSAYRYTDAGPAVPTESPENMYVFIQLRERTRGTNGEAWDVVIVKLHRDTAQLVLNFVSGDAADPCRVRPANIPTLPELLRPRPQDFATG